MEPIESHSINVLQVRKDLIEETEVSRASHDLDKKDKASALALLLGRLEKRCAQIHKSTDGENASCKSAKYGLFPNMNERSMVAESTLSHNPALGKEIQSQKNQ